MGRSMRGLILLAGALVAGLSAGCWKPEEGQHLAVSVDEYRFQPSELHAKAGEPIWIDFHNAGDMPHNLTFASIGEGTPTIEPGDSDELLIEFEEPGTYPFQCTVTNHAKMGLRGELIVEPAGSTPAS